MVNGVNVFYEKYGLNILEKWMNGESKFGWAFFNVNSVHLLSQIHGIWSWICFGAAKLFLGVCCQKSVATDFGKFFIFVDFDFLELMLTWILSFSIFILIVEHLDWSHTWSCADLVDFAN